MQIEAFYQTHLDRVSRSFAFCIAELRSPLRTWVGLAYILCRLADTLEDAQWSDRQRQLKALETMRRLALDGGFAKRAASDPTSPDAVELSAWQASFPPGIPEHEKQLVADAPKFLVDLHELSPEAREVITRTLVNMIDGMAYFCASAPVDTKIQIESLTTANQYCFFVAGIVGELLTELVRLESPEFATSQQTWKDSIHFGLFLQKVNLLKDQLGDEAEKRFLVHSREAFKSSLASDARYSLSYLTSIPVKRRDYRLFCAWSLFIGLASLPWIERAWREKSNVKISRTETGLLLARVRLKIDDNLALAKLFDELMTLEEMPGFSYAGHADVRSTEIPAWILSAYRGRISTDQMKELGMAQQ